ncbi:LysE family translocator [Pelagibius sp. Alg239-R121]|uniref:LysE family translocator n=1 Tax=Pelagibius sp. Alg239-R121 TaxID=2993448 RepID=UPI0024A62135|nr:LysE family translocator [Pelagibius sp. Alg239-R121]
MLTFAAAVFFLLITPGPGVLSAAGVGSAFGFRSGARYIVGLFIGTNLVALAVISGLAAILLATSEVRFLLLIASACYLVFLAARIALSGTKVAFIETAKPPGVWGGITLQAINPKAYAVNTTLFTGFAFWPESLASETLIKLVVINGIWIPIHFLWLGAGVWLHRLDLPARVQFRINLAMAVSMLAVVALAALAPK